MIRFSRNGIGRRMLLSTAGLGLLLGLSGCYPDGALLRSCYHADARCGWNQDRDSESQSTPSSNTPSPPDPAPAPTDPTPT